jgi:hypothetical protein
MTESQEGSNSTIQNTLIIGLWRWISVLLFAYIMILGSNAIAEIQERQSIYNLLITELQELNSKAVREESSAGLDSRAISARKERKRQLEEAIESIKHLSAAGALDANMTLTGIRKKLFGLPDDYRSFIKDSFGFVGEILMPKFIDVSATRRMYANLIIFASVMGCIVQFFRGDHQRPVRTIITGVGAGIVCFLSLDATRIELSLDGKFATFQATAGILLGFLSGVFSSHVFDAVETTIKKLRRPLDPESMI